MTAETPEEAYERGRRDMAEKVAGICLATTFRLHDHEQTAEASDGPEPRWYALFRKAAAGSRTDILRNRMGWEHWGAAELRGILASYFAAQGWPELEPSGEVAAWSEMVEWLGPHIGMTLTESERTAAKKGAAQALRLAELHVLSAPTTEGE